jgi:hypothetical protein
VTKIDFKNPARPPLLLLTGTEDRICPPSVNQANLKKQRHAPSATEGKEYPGRCHFPGQDGWEQVADDALSWTVEHAGSWVAGGAPQRSVMTRSTPFCGAAAPQRRPRKRGQRVRRSLLR